MSQTLLNRRPLPLAADEITTDWMTHALQHRYPDVAVESVEVRDIINGTSTKIRVALNYNGQGRELGLPPTMIVKGGFESHSEWMAGMYRDEVRFYRDVKPYITINTPECYYAESDPDSYQSIVLLEDLRAKDVHWQHPQEPCTYDQIARRLEAMAVYHAQTWNTSEFAPGGRFDWLQTRYQGFGKTFFHRYLEPERWNYFCRSPRGAAVSVRLHDRDWMARAFANLEAFEATQPQCVIHGDTHLGNLYLEPDGTPGFLDAQTCKACWAQEVNYHILIAADIADRAHWEKPLLAHYLSHLQRNGVDAPRFPDAWEAYRRATAYSYFVFIINENDFQTESVNTAEAARCAYAALDHGTIELLS